MSHDRRRALPINPTYVRTPRNVLAGIKTRKVHVERIEDRAYSYQVEDASGHRVLVRARSHPIEQQERDQRPRLGWRWRRMVQRLGWALKDMMLFRLW